MQIKTRGNEKSYRDGRGKCVEFGCLSYPSKEDKMRAGEIKSSDSNQAVEDEIGVARIFEIAEALPLAFGDFRQASIDGDDSTGRGSGQLVAEGISEGCHYAIGDAVRMRRRHL
ncbi:unnamed protein product [Lactuca saligna]|uniref:Uncharacterized protein n=1 Tax=Lactuca saligna TaxID=75948 RepID=A0AA35ZX56_LACSI|nr:unnamed protein product [Lactuca saligna]